MHYIVLLHTFSIITLTLSGLQTCAGFYDVNMVDDIRSHFYCNWIIIQTCSKTDHRIVKLFHDIKKSINVYITIFNWEDFFTGSQWNVNMRPLVLITCLSCRNCLQQINKLNENDIITRFVWIAMKNNSTKNLQIPINCQFVSIEKKKSGYYVLKEIYRLPSKRIKNTIGKWSFQSGPDFSKIPFQERRSNFHGQSITTLIEPKDSMNSLLIIYNFFSIPYMDLARRLNFTIIKTTDPKGRYEMSILMHWTDVQSKESFLTPLYSAWQVIFYKDIGVRIQLDGYLKPFTSTLWIAAFATVLLTGVFSYGVAKILGHVTKKKKLQITDFLDNVYQSLYIFLQKGGAKGKFTSQDIIIISQWILSICLISFYSATFISFTSVVIPKPPFRTVDDILKQKTHNIVAPKHISVGVLDNIKKSPDIKLRTLYRNHFDPKRNVKDDPVGEFCAKENYILISSELHLKRMKTAPEFQHCRISDTYIKITRRYMSWSLNEGKQYEKIFKFYLIQFTASGSLNDYFIKKFIRARLPEPSTFRGITLEDTIFLFAIFITGSLISIFVLLLEIIWNRIK